MSLKNTPRPEYPRPQFVRENNWLNLNGEWDFAFDDINLGLKERWYEKKNEEKFNLKILVPFCFQSELSGINDQNFHDIVWYKRIFELTEIFNNQRVLLNFGSVDYKCNVYLNERLVGSHEGGYIGFTIDITDYVEKQNYLVVRVEDPSTNCEIPRGKQFWEEKLSTIFYSRVTGIWQTVWIESVDLKNFIKSIKLTPKIEQDISEIFIECEVFGLGYEDLYLKSIIQYKNEIISELDLNLDFLGDRKKKRRDKAIIKEKTGMFEKMWRYMKNPNKFTFKLEIQKENLRLWDTHTPNLYDLYLELYDKNSNEVIDDIKSYFGMRKISISEGLSSDDIMQTFNQRIFLNDNPLYQKLLLVQGYWPDGLYTAPSDEAIIKDIQFIKDLGFNGLRTHQKAFDPRFLYWCDKMGVLVWGEMGNAFMFSIESCLRFITQYVEMIERDYNHPSIIAWVLLNEGWGVNRAEQDKRMVDYTISLYYFIKSIDPTRIIIDDDGWWHTKTDICTKHFYLDISLLPKDFDEERNFKEYKPFIPKFYHEPYEYFNEPIIYSEVGGYGLDFYGNTKNIFCQGKTKSSKELFERILALLKELDKRKNWIQGFCYTELYDQFQEINGLLTFDRIPKFPIENLKEELNKLFY